MTDAPEKIWAGNWLADVGETVTWDMGEWRNEQWPTVDVVEYVRADRIEELEAKLAEYKYIASVIDTQWADSQDEIADLKAKLEKAVEALEKVMVGGNHLETILPDNFPPVETGPLNALEMMGCGYDFDVWSCWQYIMLARTTLAELKGQDDELSRV